MDPSPAEVPEEVGGAPAGDGFVRPMSAADVAAGQAMLRAVYPTPAPPALANAAFAAALDASHRFRFPGKRGTRFHVKPLSYPVGTFLNAQARRFAETRQAARLDLHPQDVTAAIRHARLAHRGVATELIGVLLPLVRATHLWGRVLLRLRLLRHPVNRMNAVSLQLLLDQLLGLPDEVARRTPLIEAGQTLPPIDCLDDLGRFARECPAWVGTDGYPLSWRHYRLGTQVRVRAEARWALITFQAVGKAQTNPSEQQAWLDRMKILAGMN